jgi:deazaflavin-dependent oxidoreductase (nitroreductase family)
VTREQREKYLEGHRKNPLTTSVTGGRILSASQLPWFTLRPPKGFGVLTTTGRRTGRKRRKCVRAIRNGDRVYLVSLGGSGAAWLLNLKANPRVSLRIRDGRFEGVAREITDPTEWQHATKVYAGTVNPFDRMEYRMHRPDRPTPERIQEMHDKWFSDGTPVVIELSP